VPENAHDASAGVPAHPEQPDAARTGAVRPGPPTPAQLDERERQKTGPRRQPGPPLEGGAPAAAPVHPHEPPPPTDPEE